MIFDLLHDIGFSGSTAPTLQSNRRVFSEGEAWAETVRKGCTESGSSGSRIQEYAAIASALSSQPFGIYATVTYAELLGITLSIEEGFDTVISESGSAHTGDELTAPAPQAMGGAAISTGDKHQGRRDRPTVCKGT